MSDLFKIFFWKPVSSLILLIISGAISLAGTKEIIFLNLDHSGGPDIILKKKDGTKFFGYLSKVKANYSKSIASGELSIVKS